MSAPRSRVIAKRGLLWPLLIAVLVLWSADLSADFHDARGTSTSRTPYPTAAAQRVAELNFQVMQLIQTGDYPEATVLAEANLESALSTLGESHSYTDSAIDNLAFLYEVQDRHAKAEPLLIRLARLRAHWFGSADPLTAMVLRRLATIYVSMGRTAAAEALLRRVIPIFEARRGAGDWSTIASVSELANLCEERGDLQEAEGLHGRALTALETSVGRHHPDTAAVLSDLGALYHRQDRFDDAEPLLSEALEIQQAHLHPQSTAISLTRKRLAWLYMSQRRYSDAEGILRQDLDVTEREFGRDHPRIAHALSSLSYALVEQDKHSEAELALTRSIAIHSTARGPRSKDALQAKRKLVRVHEQQGKIEEAAVLLHDLIDVHSRQSGAADHATTELKLRLAWLRSRQGAHDQAEALFREVMAVRQQKLGATDRAVLEAREELANFLRKRARYAEAQQLFNQTLERLREDPTSDPVAIKDALVGLANILQEQGRYDDAETHLKEAIGIAEKMSDTGLDDGGLSTLYNNLSTIFQSRGKFADAKDALLKSIHMDEERFGPNSLLVATGLQNLATLYTSTGDYEAARPLFERALDLFRRAGEFHSAETTQLLGNLANLHLHTGNLYEADAAIRAALNTGRRVLGHRHPVHGLNLNTAALLAVAEGDNEGAESYLRRALAIFEAGLGPEHPYSTRALSNLGTLLAAEKRFAEAQPLLENAKTDIEAALGPTHPDMAMAWAALAYHSRERGTPEIALPYIRHANSVMRMHLGNPKRQKRTSLSALGPQSVFTLHLDILAALLEDPSERQAALIDETFRVGQQMRHTAAADALQRTAARFAAGSDDLARVVREHQDLTAAWKAADAELTFNLSRKPESRDAEIEQALRERLAALQRRLESAENHLRLEFPRYAELMHPAPMDVAEAQALLEPGEALVAYVVAPQRSYAWVLRRGAASFHVLDAGTKELRDAVVALRSTLDPRSGRGARRLGVGRSAVAGFDLGLAQRLHAMIWMPFAQELAQIKQVLVIPDGPLQSLPLTVLVEQGQADGLAATADLRKARWLVKRHAFSQLPAASSLKALRTLTSSADPGASFVGFADPLLPAGQFRHLMLAPLPESAQELQTLAELLKARDVSLFLNRAATEHQVRSIDFSGGGTLAFATHGLMAGEVDGLDEPGLVLTPHENVTDADDGFLSASEIAGLKLDVDWVILSACNTAASDGSPGGEGLSGLARSFFYSGARSLLVSHWSVYSRAAVDITTGMLRVMKDARGIGRSEALRRSLEKLIENGENPHPSYWAPFVLVGDGRALQRTAR